LALSHPAFIGLIAAGASASFSAGAASPPGISDRRNRLGFRHAQDVHDFGCSGFSFTMPPVTGDGEIMMDHHDQLQANEGDGALVNLVGGVGL
jgi:hypothetical protein